MWKWFYFFSILAELSFCEWIHLKENVAPIQGFTNEYIDSSQNENYISYKSLIDKNMVFNITDINIGFGKIQLIFLVTNPLEEKLVIQNENGKNYNDLSCYKITKRTFTCSYELVPDQQAYIYFELLPQIVEYHISNIQLMINICLRGCIKCLKEDCILCENDYVTTKVDKKYCLQQKTQKNEYCQNFQHLGQTYESCIQQNITNIYEIYNTDENQMIIDSTDQQLGKVSIDNQIFKGPYQQNDHFTIKLNETLNGLNNIQIEFTIFILGDFLVNKFIRIQINNYDSLAIEDYQEIQNQRCTSNFSIQCSQVQMVIPIVNIQDLSNLTIKNNYPLRQFDKGWTIGQLKIKISNTLPCQFKIYNRHCVKYCPIYTEEKQQNVCIDVFKEKYLNLIEKKFVTISECLNQIELKIIQPFFAFQSNYYFYFQNNYYINKYALDNVSGLLLNFKLIIFNANIQSKITLSIQQIKKEFSVNDLQKIDQIIGYDNIYFYYLNIQQEYISLQDSDKQINFKLTCSQMACAISQLFILEINCPKFANNSNCGNLDFQKQNYSNFCLDGYFYENFSCQKCLNSDCVKCLDRFNCIECSKNFVLYANQCFYNSQNQTYTNQKYYYIQNKNIIDSLQEQTFCLNQSEIRNQQYCDCRVGYFLKNKSSCNKCSQTCFECNDNPNNCQKCAELSNRILEAHVCVCKEGYYETEDNQKCEQCSKHCKSCSFSPFVCSNCFTEQNRILKENQCICNEGYYLDIITDICLKCSSVCEKCRMDGKCLKCFENQHRYLTINNECNCKDGFYEDEQNNCIACHYSCQSCDNSEEFNKCTECPSNRIKKNENLNHFECICEYGYYDDGAQICKDCSQINSANPGDHCYSYCGDGIVQWNEDCDNGVQIIRNDCYKCKFPVSKCNPDLCSICSKQECQQCYAGYYLDLDYSCKKCSIQCLTCSKNPDNCIECSTNTNQCSLCSQSKGYEYKHEQCLPICGDGYIVNQEECDDQNLNDNDGCDKSCKIEKGFQCYGNICLNNKEKLIIKENKLDKVYENQRSFIFYIENSKNLNINDLQFHLDQTILYFVEGVNITVLEQSDQEKFREIIRKLIFNCGFKRFQEFSKNSCSSIFQQKQLHILKF